MPTVCPERGHMTASAHSIPRSGARKSCLSPAFSLAPDLAFAHSPFYVRTSIGKGRFLPPWGMSTTCPKPGSLHLAPVTVGARSFSAVRVLCTAGWLAASLVSTCSVQAAPTPTCGHPTCLQTLPIAPRGTKGSHCHKWMATLRNNRAVTLWFNSCLPRALSFFLQGEQASLKTRKEGFTGLRLS